MNKYHISKKGNPAICRAKEGNCPLGGTEVHFESKEDAKIYIEKRNEMNFGIVPSMSLELPVIRRQAILARESFDKSKFTSIKGNRGNNKPLDGGYWTSSMEDNGRTDWLEFSESEGFYESGEKMKYIQIDISKDAKVLSINSVEDYNRVIELYGREKGENENLANLDKVIDLDKLSKDYDGFNLTRKGFFANQDNFTGWDCECTLWFNIDKFEKVEETEHEIKNKYED